MTETRKQEQEYTMSKEDWAALYVVYQVARIICTQGVRALPSLPVEGASHGE